MRMEYAIAIGICFVSCGIILGGILIGIFSPTITKEIRHVKSS